MSDMHASRRLTANGVSDKLCARVWEMHGSLMGDSARLSINIPMHRC